MTASPDGLPAPPVLDVDPYTVENLISPYAFHEQLREAGPVVQLRKYGVYAVGRYEEIKAVMSDYERFSSAAGIGMVDRRTPGIESFRTTSPLTEEDPPVHTKTRAGMQKLLSPLVIRGWRERFEAKAEELCEELLARNEPINAARELSEEFVTTVFPESLGLDVPKEYLPLIGEMNFFSLGPQNDMQRQAYERVKHAIDYYNDAVLRENVKPGTFGDIIYKAEDEGVFEKGVGIGLIRSFLRAGTDTTVAGISAALMFLAQNPEQWEILKADPSKAKVAFEEAIRLESPSAALYRITTRDMDFQGYSLKANTKIGFFTSAGNRDPRRWDNPGKYDIRRDIVGHHIAFGHGVHNCIGQMIARLEAETLLQAVLRRFDRLELLAEPVWRPVSALRNLSELRLRLVPRPAYPGTQA